jgi:hypothetical protein
MAPVTSIAWTTLYARNREDEGTFQSLFDEELAALVNRTASHLANPDKLVQDIAGSMNGNMMMIPGEAGRMHLLHHGFVCNQPEGFDLVFVQGNLGECFYFKVLPREEATTQIQINTGRRPSTTNCPTLASMRGATTADEFAALEPDGNTILLQKPNHVVIHPVIFLLAKGAPTVHSRQLALTILDGIRIVPEDEADEEETARKEVEALGLELLLGMLWASENDGLTDIQENPTLNHAILALKGKVRNGGGRGVGTPAGDDGERNEGDEVMTASQGIVRELNRMHESRENENSLKQSNLSLLKALGPEQK